MKEKKDDFIKYVKDIENEDIKILKLQEQYRNGSMKEEEMTKEQITKLCDLYDKQIAELEKSNNYRKQKLLEYRRKMRKNNN